MKLILEPTARFKLERLCDYKHPREVGGKLLGNRTEKTFIVKDIFAIPNASETPRNTYVEYSPYTYFLDIYEKIVKLSKIGNFHSHPNGTVPSEGDMKACSGLNVWLIHHNRGEHTFVSARNYEHLETILLNEPQERRSSGFLDNKFFLGDIEIDSFGRVIGEMKSLELLKLPEKTRIAYLKFLQLKDSWNEVETKQLAEALNVTRQTARNWLKKAKKLVRTTRYGFKER